MALSLLALVTCLDSGDVTGLPSQALERRQGQGRGRKWRLGAQWPRFTHSAPVSFRSPCLFVLPACVLIPFEEKGRLRLTLGRLSPCPNHAYNKTREALVWKMQRPESIHSLAVTLPGEYGGSHTYSCNTASGLLSCLGKG